MSTDLYGVRVIEVDREDLLLEVFAVYLDIKIDATSTRLAYQLPHSASFVAGALADVAAAETAYGRLWHERGRDAYTCADEAIAEVEELERVEPASADALLTRVQSDSPGAPIPPQPADPPGRKARHNQAEYRELFFHRDPALRGGHGGWRDESLLPRAVVFVRVTDACWIEHLVSGLSWSTTAYDD